MEDRCIKVGPQGGGGGSDWDDGIHDGVREIFIWHSDSINAIQTLYDTNGRPFLGSKRGGDGNNFNSVQLSYPAEHLTEVSGWVGTKIDPCHHLGGTTFVKAIKFCSNKATYGPFGDKNCYEDPSLGGQSFCFGIAGNRICGFFGRSDGHCLHAVGIHAKPTPSSRSDFVLRSPMGPSINFYRSSPGSAPSFYPSGKLFGSTNYGDS